VSWTEEFVTQSHQHVKVVQLAGSSLLMPHEERRRKHKQNCENRQCDRRPSREDHWINVPEEWDIYQRLLSNLRLGAT
jgi:hypothetical protein